MSRILVIGAAHLDRRGTIAGPVHLKASNPGEWRSQAGGGGFNAACALAALGNAVTLIAPRGGDDAGETVSEAATAAGIADRPIVFLDRATPTYTAILDPDGDLVVALADMALYERFSPRQIQRRPLRDAIAAHDAVLTDANLPAATLLALADHCAAAAKPLFAIAISPAKVTRLKDAFPQISCLFMNAREAAALTGRTVANRAEWPGLLRAEGLRMGVVSDGAEAIVAFDGTKQWTVRPPRVDGVRDVTGAGDTLTATVIAARFAGHDLPEAVRRGVAGAALSVASPDCVPDTLSNETVAEGLRLVPQAERMQDEDVAPLLPPSDRPSSD